MPAFFVELAKESDALAIAEMSRDHIETGLKWKYRKARILELMRKADTNVVVARLQTDSPPIGFAVMDYVGFEAHLILFAVQPAWRRRGVGRALIHWHLETARVAGAQSVYVEVRRDSKPARAFYRSFGFAELPDQKVHYSPDVPGLRMALDLRVKARER